MNEAAKVLRPDTGLLEKLEVGKDLSGGVRIGMGSHYCVLSPREAVNFAEGVLKAAGVTVEFRSLFPGVRQ